MISFQFHWTDSENLDDHLRVWLLATTFQFHWTDSATIYILFCYLALHESFNSIERIHVFRGKFKCDFMLVFQFHWTDSWCRSLRGYLLSMLPLSIPLNGFRNICYVKGWGEQVPFNSIERILQISRYMSICTGISFQFHWTDSICYWDVAVA